MKRNHLLSIIAGDRPGLLARIAHVWHITTLISAAPRLIPGPRAEDTFWITGTALDQPQAVAALCLD